MSSKMDTICKLLIATLLILLNFLNVAHAWGGYGHRWIAEIAWDRMTPEAQEMSYKLLSSGLDAGGLCDEAKSILPNDKKQTFINFASWLDCSRSSEQIIEITSPFGNLVHGDRYPHCPLSSPNKYCPSGRCASNALKRTIKDLNDPLTAVKMRRLSLKTILHLMGDLHQPLHSFGRPLLIKVTDASEPKDLHAFWDGDVPRLVRKDKVLLKSILETKSEEIQEGNVDSWMSEVYQQARTAFTSLLGEEHLCSSSADPILLTQDYITEAHDLGSLKIAEGGIRLAKILNEAAKNEKKWHPVFTNETDVHYLYSVGIINPHQTTIDEDHIIDDSSKD